MYNLSNKLELHASLQTTSATSSHHILNLIPYLHHRSNISLFLSLAKRPSSLQLVPLSPQIPYPVVLLLLPFAFPIRFSHLSQPLPNHTSDNLKTHLRGHQRRLLPNPIISRRNLDDIGADEVQGFETAQDLDEFARGPAAGFGGACAGALLRVAG